jgi:hypothetical protein
MIPDGDKQIVYPCSLMNLEMGFKEIITKFGV